MCTEHGAVGEADSARIVASGSEAVIRLGWAVCRRFGNGHVRVSLHTDVLLPGAARELERWLSVEARQRITVEVTSPQGALAIEFLDPEAAIRWVRGVADTSALEGSLAWTRAMAATWLDEEGRHVPSLSDLRVRRVAPDTACFALQTMGCIALRWPPQAVPAGRMRGGPSDWLEPSRPLGPPLCVMVDPRALRKPPLAALRMRVAAFGDRAIGLEWYDGVAWQVETQACETVADRIDHLRRMFQEPAVSSGLNAIDMDMSALVGGTTGIGGAQAGRSLLNGWGHIGGAAAPLERIVQRWSDLIETPGLRAKLLQVEPGGGLTFRRYSAGGHSFYDRHGDERVLSGRSLDAVPNPRLADQLLSTARRLRSESDGLLEKVSGHSWSVGDGPIRIDYWRLSVPVGVTKRGAQGFLMTTGGFKVQRRP